MGLNAVVTFQLIGHLQLTWPQAMTIIQLEGLIILLLVETRFRLAVMEAVPLVLKRSIGADIGLFIALIGFANSGLVVAGHGTVLTLGNVKTLPLAALPMQAVTPLILKVLPALRKEGGQV
jgi:adenine/guanine/hypoxanthine permease